MKRLLIVDDQPGIRLLLAELFRREGYSTTLAANGFEAFVEVEKSPPDCILLDMKMPGMNGIDVLEKLKKDWAHIPVIMMTAYEEVELTNKALKLGAVKYFTKPFDVYEVRDAVKNIFED